MSVAGPATSVPGVLFWGLGYGARASVYRGISGRSWLPGPINVIWRSSTWCLASRWMVEVLRALCGDLRQLERQPLRILFRPGLWLPPDGRRRPFIPSGNLIGGVWFIFMVVPVGAAQNAYQQVLLSARFWHPHRRIMQRDAPLDRACRSATWSTTTLSAMSHSAYP